MEVIMDGNGFILKFPPHSPSQTCPISFIHIKSGSQNILGMFIPGKGIVFFSVYIFTIFFLSLGERSLESHKNVPREQSVVVSIRRWQNIVVSRRMEGCYNKTELEGLQLTGSLNLNILSNIIQHVSACLLMSFHLVATLQPVVVFLRNPSAMFVIRRL